MSPDSQKDNAIAQTALNPSRTKRLPIPGCAAFLPRTGTAASLHRYTADVDPKAPAALRLRVGVPPRFRWTVLRRTPGRPRLGSAYPNSGRATEPSPCSPRASCQSGLRLSPVGASGSACLSDHVRRVFGGADVPATFARNRAGACRIASNGDSCELCFLLEQKPR